MDEGFPPRTLEESVIAALVFFDLFDYPLTIEELVCYLPGIEASRTDLETVLHKQEKIRHIKGYYFLEDRAETVALREERALIAAKYWKKLRRFLPLIQMIPYVRMVAVCNTLAFNNPTEESDIDLFIVTERGRLFLARTLTTMLFGLLGVRRHGEKIAGRFCLSFYVSEEALYLEPIMNSPQDVYLPYWLLTLRPVYGQKMYRRFIAENTWINRYFPRRLDAENINFWSVNGVFCGLAKLQEFILNLGIGVFIEKCLQNMHMRRYAKNMKNLGPMASVVVDEKMLKFHNIDRRNEFFERFRRNFEQFIS